MVTQAQGKQDNTDLQLYDLVPVWVSPRSMAKTTDAVPSSEIVPPPRLRLIFTVTRIPSIFTLFFVCYTNLDHTAVQLFFQEAAKPCMVPL